MNIQKQKDENDVSYISMRKKIGIIYNCCFRPQIVLNCGIHNLIQKIRPQQS